MIITIDGAIGTGKSTIAKKLASEIGFIFFDTGAMYRCVTYGIIKNNIDINNLEALKAFLEGFTFEIKVRKGERFYFVDNEDVSLTIRGHLITSMVSKISAIPAVREKLVALQRTLSIGVNAVFEGRDMGSVVFPDAQLKIFLTGLPEIRAARRLAEIQAKLPEEAANLTLEKLLEEINLRDEQDSKREISPLMQCKDSCVIDTSNLTIDEVIIKILEFKDTMKTRLKK